MGSSRENDDPDEILKQNHQMLTDIHGGRYKNILSSPFLFLWIPFMSLFPFSFYVDSVSCFDE